MKKKTYLFALMAMAMTWSGCSDSEDVMGGEKSQIITVSTSIGNMSRVATDANGSQTFEEGDEISVYAWMGEANVAPKTEALVVNNSINKLTGGKWVATPQMRWKNNTDPHYFIGIYPATTVTDLTAGAYTFDVTDQEKSDLLVAVNNQGLTFQKDAQNAVQLHFSHVMAKVVVNLTYKSQWSAVPTVEKLTMAKVAQEASVNYLTKKVTAGTEKVADLTLPASKANEKYVSVLIPQNGVQIVSVTIDGKDFVYDNGTPFSFESGKTTIINLSVGREEITLDDVKISDWAEGDTFGGEALD